MRGTAPAGAFRSATAEGGSWREDNPRRDTPSAQAKQRILRIRCLGAFLETGSLDPPPAVLRLFPRTIEILSFQNFYKVLKTCSAGRKGFFDTLRSAPKERTLVCRENRLCILAAAGRLCRACACHEQTGQARRSVRSFRFLFPPNGYVCCYFAADSV